MVEDDGSASESSWTRHAIDSINGVFPYLLGVLLAVALMAIVCIATA